MNRHRPTDPSRRRALAALSLPLIPWMLTGTAHAATLEEVRKRGYLVVITEDDFKPFEFIQGSSGKYDIAITAALITKERTQSLDFASPIADATHYYVKRKSDASIKSVKDLSGKRIGVQGGSAMLARLPELAAMLAKTGGTLGKITEYTSYPEAYQDLALGRTDVVINTVINLKSLAAEKPAIFELGQAVSGKSYPGWAVKKGNTELLKFINEFIAKQKANGTMPALQKEWFGEAFDLPASFTPEV